MQPILTIDLNLIAQNFLYMQSRTKAEIAVALKANAYGLGAEHIANKLSSLGCKKFFFASVEEALSIKTNQSLSKYILSGLIENEIELFLTNSDLIPVLNNLEQIRLWQNKAPQKNCAIHIDTGMNRLGLNVEDFLSLESLPANTNLLMSHLAVDSEPDNQYNKKQLDDFLNATKKYPNCKKSLAASGGLFLGPEYHFDIARIGAAIYGIGAKYNSNLKNPVSLSAPIIQIRKSTKDEYVGYGCTSQVKAGTVLATIPIGYADGFSRFFSNIGMLYFNNKAVKIIGRVSMDLVVIDITGTNANIGDIVEIIGNNNLPDNLALQINTIGYEILTSLNSLRAKRQYLHL